MVADRLQQCTKLNLNGFTGEIQISQARRSALILVKASVYNTFDHRVWKTFAALYCSVPICTWHLHAVFWYLEKNACVNKNRRCFLWLVMTSMRSQAHIMITESAEMHSEDESSSQIKWALFLVSANVAQTGENGAFGRDYFQGQMRRAIPRVNHNLEISQFNGCVLVENSGFLWHRGISNIKLWLHSQNLWGQFIVFFSLFSGFV